MLVINLTKKSKPMNKIFQMMKKKKNSNKRKIRIKKYNKMINWYKWNKNIKHKNYNKLWILNDIKQFCDYTFVVNFSESFSTILFSKRFLS